VGGALRRYRDHLGYKLDDIAGVLECDRSKVSRIESGLRGIRSKELRELLDEYGVPAAEQQTLLRLAARQHAPDWLAPDASVLPGEVTEYFGLEPVATEIMIYEAHAVPALLRTTPYAHVIAETGFGSPPADHAGQMTAAHERRQQQILDGSRQVNVVIGEAALRQQVGSHRVTAGQLDHLSALSGNASVTVQVLPFTAGAQAASGTASFTLLRFGGDIAVVFVPALTGGIFIDDPAEVASYLHAFTWLRAGALTGPDTARLLRDTAGPPWD
jgi:transcriptional regulator with XRE-family HTH domain